MADTLIFLEIPGIKGDSTINGFEDQIELESANWGLSAKHTDKGSGKVTTDLRPQLLSVSKFFDKASINLCQYMAARKKFDKATLRYVDLQIEPGGAKAVKVMELLLNGDCYVEDFKLDASEGGSSVAVKETVQFTCREIKLTYYPVSINKSLTERGKSGQDFLCVMPNSDD